MDLDGLLSGFVNDSKRGGQQQQQQPAHPQQQQQAHPQQQQQAYAQQQHAGGYSGAASAPPPPQQQLTPLAAAFARKALDDRRRCEQACHEVMRMTNLTQEYATMCLDASGWSVPQALQTFQQKRHTLGPDAFQRPGGMPPQQQAAAQPAPNDFGDFQAPARPAADEFGDFAGPAQPPPAQQQPPPASAADFGDFAAPPQPGPAVSMATPPHPMARQPPPPQPAAEPPAVEPEGWACPRCTFVNHPALTKCEMCEAPCPAAPPPRAAAPPVVVQPPPADDFGAFAAPRPPTVFPHVKSPSGQARAGVATPAAAPPSAAPFVKTPARGSVKSPAPSGPASAARPVHAAPPLPSIPSPKGPAPPAPPAADFGAFAAPAVSATPPAPQGDSPVVQATGGVASAPPTTDAFGFGDFQSTPSPVDEAGALPPPVATPASSGPPPLPAIASPKGAGTSNTQQADDFGDFQSTPVPAEAAAPAAPAPARAAVPPLPPIDSPKAPSRDSGAAARAPQQADNFGDFAPPPAGNALAAAPMDDFGAFSAPAAAAPVPGPPPLPAIGPEAPETGIGFGAFAASPPAPQQEDFGAFNAPAPKPSVSATPPAPAVGAGSLGDSPVVHGGSAASAPPTTDAFGFGDFQSTPSPADEAGALPPLVATPASSGPPPLPAIASPKGAGPSNTQQADDFGDFQSTPAPADGTAVVPVADAAPVSSGPPPLPPIASPKAAPGRGGDFAPPPPVEADTSLAPPEDDFGAFNAPAPKPPVSATPPAPAVGAGSLGDSPVVQGGGSAASAPPTTDAFGFGDFQSTPSPADEGVAAIPAPVAATSSGPPPLPAIASPGGAVDADAAVATQQADDFAFGDFQSTPATAEGRSATVPREAVPPPLPPIESPKAAPPPPQAEDDFGDFAPAPDAQPPAAAPPALSHDFGAFSAPASAAGAGSQRESPVVHSAPPTTDAFGDFQSTPSPADEGATAVPAPPVVAAPASSGPPPPPAIASPKGAARQQADDFACGDFQSTPAAGNKGAAPAVEQALPLPPIEQPEGPPAPPQAAADDDFGDFVAFAAPSLPQPGVQETRATTAPPAEGQPQASPAAAGGGSTSAPPAAADDFFGTFAPPAAAPAADGFGAFAAPTAAAALDDLFGLGAVAKPAVERVETEPMLEDAAASKTPIIDVAAGPASPAGSTNSPARTPGRFSKFSPKNLYSKMKEKREKPADLEVKPVTPTFLAAKDPSAPPSPLTGAPMFDAAVLGTALAAGEQKSVELAVMLEARRGAGGACGPAFKAMLLDSGVNVGGMLDVASLARLAGVPEDDRQLLEATARSFAEPLAAAVTGDDVDVDAALALNKDRMAWALREGAALLAKISPARLRLGIEALSRAERHLGLVLLQVKSADPLQAAAVCRYQTKHLEGLLELAGMAATALEKFAVAEPVLTERSRAVLQKVQKIAEAVSIDVPKPPPPGGFFVLCELSGAVMDEAALASAVDRPEGMVCMAASKLWDAINAQ